MIKVIVIFFKVQNNVLLDVKIENLAMDFVIRNVIIVTAIEI